MRRVTVLLIVIATGALLWSHLHRGDQSARARPTGFAMHAVRAQQVASRVPVGWRATRRDGYALWVAPDRRGTLVLASAAADPQVPLEQVVASTRTELPRQAPNFRDSRIATMRAADGATGIRHDFLVGPAAASMHVVQVWRRDARAARDVVATYTWAGTGELPQGLVQLPSLAGSSAAR